MVRPMTPIGKKRSSPDQSCHVLDAKTGLMNSEQMNMLDMRNILVMIASGKALRARMSRFHRARLSDRYAHVQDIVRRAVSECSPEQPPLMLNICSVPEMSVTLVPSILVWMPKS